MITVYYGKVSPFLEEDAFCIQLKKVSKDRREKILRMTNEAARRRCLAAGTLLHHALCETLGFSYEDTAPFSVNYGEKGKPYLTEYAGIHFNLSHSGDYVCCAISDGPVGVDIQEKGKVRMALAERFFTPAERQMLSECGEEQRQDLFFRMWSIKESYLKLTGEGLSGGLSGFEILWQEKGIVRRQPGKEKGQAEAYFEETDAVPGYSFCVCAGDELGEVCWKTCIYM